MAKQTYIETSLNVTLVTQLISDVIFAKTGYSPGSGTDGLLLPFSGIVTPPQGAIHVEMITPGAYFFPTPETVFSEQTIQQRDEIIAFGIANQGVIGVYSYFSKNVVMRFAYA